MVEWDVGFVRILVNEHGMPLTEGPSTYILSTHSNVEFCQKMRCQLARDLDASGVAFSSEWILNVCLFPKYRDMEAKYGSRHSTTAEEASKFQRLFLNLQLVDTRKGIKSPKPHSNTHG